MLTLAANRLKDRVAPFAPTEELRSMLAFALDDDTQVLRIVEQMQDEMHDDEGRERIGNAIAVYKREVAMPASIAAPQPQTNQQVFAQLLTLPEVQQRMLMLPDVQNLLRAYMAGQLPPAYTLQHAMPPDSMESLGFDHIARVPNREGQRIRQSLGLDQKPTDIDEIIAANDADLRGKGAYLFRPELLPDAQGLRADDVTVYALMFARDRWSKARAKTAAAGMVAANEDIKPRGVSEKKANDEGLGALYEDNHIFLLRSPTAYSIDGAKSLELGGGVYAMIARAVKPADLESRAAHRFDTVVRALQSMAKGVAA